ncbi:suppressor of fused domain protein [Corallococcus interemptor]|uniref:imm11 family protein n=1 Tax=Corallococcus interemptor TaxID=2316720 RepID=UPI0035D4CC80
MRYFKLLDDMDIRDRWLPGEATNAQGQEIDDIWQFADGCPVQVDERLTIPIGHPGVVQDFSTSSVGGTPVVHRRVANVFAELAQDDVQLIPVEVEGQSEPYFILVATRTVRCIDDEQSAEVKYWLPEDDRPELTGTYRAVYGMRIDPTKVGDAKVFRPWGWTVALLVSEDLKDALERSGATGMAFREVTGPSEVTPEQREHSRKLKVLYDRTETARTAFWRTLGTLDDKAILPIVVGGGWPARRQVWRVIHRPEGRTLFVTDGLSDFFVDTVEPSVGFGLELALETDEPKATWPVTLLERIANELVGHEHLREPARTGILSMEVDGERMPEPLLTKEGRVAVLLGIDTPALPSHFTMPDGQVRLVTVKTLMPRELTYLLEHGREELLHRFNRTHPGHLSKAWRQPVV